jgi:molybdopterin biosynthesis enzyme MoaB
LIFLGHKEHKHRAPKTVKCGVITIRDTRAEAQDTSGQAIVGLLNAAGVDVFIL